MARIGVEQSLSAVSQTLQEKGYEVVELKKEQDAKSCDVCVITGQDQNIMGIQTIVTEGSVINAHGLSADEIGRLVEEKINLQH
ncbi:MAG TPA: YkuS family protein [Bacilli bacterium]|nr:YkuS family protein [Bacilli bacterium]